MTADRDREISQTGRSQWPAVWCGYCSGVACWRPELARCPCSCHTKPDSVNQP